MKQRLQREAICERSDHELGLNRDPPPQAQETQIEMEGDQMAQEREDSPLLLIARRGSRSSRAHIFH